MSHVAAGPNLQDGWMDAYLHRIHLLVRSSQIQLFGEDMLVLAISFVTCVLSISS